MLLTTGAPWEARRVLVPMPKAAYWLLHGWRHWTAMRASILTPATDSLSPGLAGFEAPDEAHRKDPNGAALVTSPLCLASETVHELCRWPFPFLCLCLIRSRDLWEPGAGMFTRTWKHENTPFFEGEGIHAFGGILKSSWMLLSFSHWKYQVCFLYKQAFSFILLLLFYIPILWLKYFICLKIFFLTWPDCLKQSRLCWKRIVSDLSFNWGGKQTYK